MVGPEGLEPPSVVAVSRGLVTARSITGAFTNFATAPWSLLITPKKPGVGSRTSCCTRVPHPACAAWFPARVPLLLAAAQGT